MGRLSFNTGRRRWSRRFITVLCGNFVGGAIAPRAPPPLSVLPTHFMILATIKFPGKTEAPVSAPGWDSGDSVEVSGLDVLFSWFDIMNPSDRLLWKRENAVADR
jgi:ABC-type uncharacterized transport system permease subunit